MIEKKEEKLGLQIQLPTEKRAPVRVNPKHLLIYGKPKSGKTTAVSTLENCLIVDVESGTEFVNGMIVQPPAGSGPVAIYKWLKELAKTIKEAGYPYDYVAIDTISQLDILAEWVGTYNYMQSAQGKKFNRDCNGNMLRPDHPEYESVLSLGNGYGYRYTREAIMDIYDTLKDLGKVCTIFICHVADKMVSSKNGEEVMVKDLALVGN